MTIDKAYIKKLSDMVVKAVLDGVPASKAVNDAWVKMKIPNVLFSEVRGVALKEAMKVLGGLAGETASRVLVWERLINENDVVRKQVRQASARARRDLVNDVKQILKDGEATRASAVRLQETAPSNTGVLRKEIQKISKVGGTAPALRNLKSKLSRELTRNETRGAYRAVIDAVDKGLPDKIAKAVDLAIIEKTRYNMERVIRTERARATAEADREMIANEDVEFVKFVLASGHKSDICDAYANADMGYGKGVYPIDKAPVLPIHPNGQSRLVPVYVAKKTGKEVNPDEAVQNTADKYGVKAYDGIKLSPIKKRL